jgi:uncharacterized repeat protein (TIGR01451 family)
MAGVRRLVVALLALSIGLGLALVTASVTAPAASAATPVPFTCTVPTVFDSNGSPTVLDAQYQTAGSSQFVAVGGPASVTYNAIGYNTANNLIYGVDVVGTTAHLVIIDATGAVFDQGTITGLSSAAMTVGFFDAAGNYWIQDGNVGTLYRVNLTTRVATPLVGQTLKVFSFDLTYANGYAWGVESGTQTGGVGFMYRVDLSTGVVTRFNVNSILPVGTSAPSAFYGAAWTYVNGNLGFDRNDGGLYQVSVTNPSSSTPTFALIAKASGPASDVNDGASCGSPANLAITKTAATAADPGAGTIVTPSGTVTWTLTVTNQGPGYSSGFTLNDTIPSGYTNIAVTGASSNIPGASSANGYGCTITANAVRCVEGFGSAGLAPGASATLTFTATAPTTGCLTNVASTLGNESVNGTQNSNGSTTCVASYTTAKAASGPNASGVVNYTVTVSNTGSAAYTTALPATFSDNLGDVLDDATYVAGSASSTVTGWTFSGPSGTPATLTGAGPLAVGQTATVTYQVKINSPDLGNGKLINVVTPTGPGGGCAPNAASCTTTTALPTMAQVNKTWVMTDPAGHVVGTFNVPSQVTDTSSTLPAGFLAAPTLTGQGTAVFGVPYGGYAVGQGVTVGEGPVAVPTGCVLKTSKLTAVNGTTLATAAALPYSGTLTPNLTTFTITNTVTCTQTLTLVKVVDYGSLPASSWTLTGTGPSGALPGPGGATGTTAATADISPASSYTLAESATAAGSQNYSATSAGWTCTDNATGSTVAVSSSKITTRYGQSATCTIHNVTAKVTVLKHVQPPAGSLTAGQFNLTLTPPSALGSALTFSGSESANASNTFEVRPGSSYGLSEQSVSSTVAYLALGLQVSTDGGTTWTNVPNGQISPTPGRQLYYRLVNQAVPALALPLTGGVGIDVVTFWGVGLLLAAASLACWQTSRTNRMRRP